MAKRWLQEDKTKKHCMHKYSVYVSLKKKWNPSPKLSPSNQTKAEKQEPLKNTWECWHLHLKTHTQMQFNSRITQSNPLRHKANVRQRAPYVNTRPHTQFWLLRRVVTQAAAGILKNHVCTVNVEQLIWIYWYKDASYVGLKVEGQKRNDEKLHQAMVVVIAVDYVESNIHIWVPGHSASSGSSQL